MRNWTRWLLVGGSIFLGTFLGLWLVLLLAYTGFAVPFEVIFHLAGGWFLHAQRVFPQLAWDVESVTLGGLCLVLFTSGLHGFLRWYAQAPREADNSAANRTKVWKAAWTIKLTALILVSFAAAISLLGVAHQIVWLGRSPAPLVARYPRLGD